MGSRSATPSPPGRFHDRIHPRGRRFLAVAPCSTRGRAAGEDPAAGRFAVSWGLHCPPRPGLEIAPGALQGMLHDALCVAAAIRSEVDACHCPGIHQAPLSSPRQAIGPNTSLSPWQSRLRAPPSLSKLYHDGFVPRRCIHPGPRPGALLPDRRLRPAPPRQPPPGDPSWC
jgi:hypothetical protein